MIFISLKLSVILQVIYLRQLDHNLLSSRKLWYNSYDYIIVGGGTAGCVVAARLAEDNSKTVLLLEAGGPQTVTSDIPVKQSLLFGSHMDWSYPMIPQKYAYISKTDHQMNLPRGRVFGGSSVLNAMNYYRESPEYYELWDTLYGLKNWTYWDVLPYFLRSENNLDSSLVQESNGYHRTDGLLSVSTASDIILERYVKAAQMMGYPKTYPDGREPFGVTIMQRTIKDGVRQSSSVAFLESNYKSNLHTVGYSQVTKILFNDKKRAVGVMFHRNGTDHKVLAKKEVIISAGSVGSPHLLLLSGIGPKEHLQNFNISVISNLKVGHNLLHAIYSELYFDIKNQSEIPKPISNIDNLYEYFVKQSGPLAYKASGLQCFREVSHEKYSNLSNGCVLPRLQFLGEDLEKLTTNHKLKNQWEDYYRPYLGRALFSLLAVLRRPKSKGQIRLASKNPFDNPLIDPCVFCDNSDIDVLVKTFKLSLAIYESTYFQQFIQLYNNSIPGCNPCPDNYFCDPYIRCIVQTMNGYISPVGTCRIGVSNDEEAVVDQRMRVRGVQSLRVIDSSVIPISGKQTYAITIMIGERGAQFLKDDSV